MISIIIPAYNEEKYLPKLLGCIKSQTYRDYEILVADANSADKTREIARKYGCRIVKGGLPAVGRNRGARAAKGEILLFLDADCQIGENFLKNALNEINERQLDAAATHIYPISANLIDKIFLCIFNIWASLTQFFNPHAVGSGIFCKKWLHKKIRGFDESIKLAEDMEYIKKCGRHGRFRILKGVKLYYSMRRYTKEGRFKVGFKILLGAMHRIFFWRDKKQYF